MFFQFSKHIPLWLRDVINERALDSINCLYCYTITVNNVFLKLLYVTEVATVCSVIVLKGLIAG